MGNRFFIIERYIHREILTRLFWIAGLLFLVLASNKFVEFLADAAAGKIGVELIFKMLWLKMLAVQPKLLPIILFLSVILAYARLNRDNELIILSISGIGKVKQLLIVARFSVVICILVAGITFFAAPWAESKLLEVKSQAKQESDITGITAGQFREFSKGNRVVYVEELSEDKRAMENVFLQIRQRNKLGVLTSDRARFDIDKDSGHRYIVFENGKRYIGKPGKLDYQITEYEKYGVIIETKNIESIATKLAAVPTSVLMVSKLPLHRAELQWRISSVLACFLLALLAVLLNQFSLGEKPYVLIFISILVYFIYSNLLGISKTLLKRDEISPYIGLWWVHLILIFILILLYYVPVLVRMGKSNNNFQVLSAEE
jgi:lipopolysaccharide export system permease protein